MKSHTFVEKADPGGIGFFAVTQNCSSKFARRKDHFFERYVGFPELKVSYIVAPDLRLGSTKGDGYKGGRIHGGSDIVGRDCAEKSAMF